MSLRSIAHFAHRPVLDSASADIVVLKDIVVFGESPSGKAAGFDPAIRRFESYLPSHSRLRPGSQTLPTPTFCRSRAANAR